MNGKKLPDSNSIHPCLNSKTISYVKPTIKNKNIIVGDFTYFDDDDFEEHVTHFYPFNNDKLIIGKFCCIAKGVNFVMNGANHQMNALSTYPFYIMEGFNQQPPKTCDLPLKGDTVIGNDVWIGQNVTILPGVHISDGCIIGLNTTIGCNVEPYSIVIGNPARVIRKRFDDETIKLLLEFKWWDKPVEEVNDLIPILTSSNLEYVKNEIKKRLK